MRIRRYRQVGLGRDRSCSRLTGKPDSINHTRLLVRLNSGLRITSLPRASRGYELRVTSHQSRALAEDVFDLVEDGGIAVGWLVFDFEGGAELFDQLALFAG
jgi:hypothetical protein